MKLPGAEYNRGMSGLGRDSSDPTAVSRAEYAAASAKGQVASAIGQTADVIEAWALANDRMSAMEASSKYALEMSAAVEEIKTRPTVKVSEFPEGVRLKEGDEREEVPTWVVAPQLYDAAEKQAYARASKVPQNRKVRANLEGELTTQRVANGKAVSSFHISEKRKHWEGQLEMAVKGAVAADNPSLAIQHIDKAVEAGIIDYKEAVTKKTKVLHDAEDLRVARSIAEETDPGKLEVLGNQVLFESASMLSPDERRAYASTANSKADKLIAERTRKEDKEQREKSKEILGTLATKIRLQGYIPKASELAEAKATLNPADYLALIALVDRKDGSGGGIGTTDVGTARELQQRIQSLSYPDSTGQPIDKAANVVYDSILKAFADGKLSLKDREAFVAQWERYRDRPMRKSPEYSGAEDLIEANILPPKGMLAAMEFKDASRYNSISMDMKLALADATRANPNLDPRQWVRENLPSYKARTSGVAYEKLFNLGLTGFVVVKDGVVDADASIKQIEDAIRDKRISTEAGRNAINEISRTKGQSTAAPQNAASQQSKPAVGLPAGVRPR